MARSVYQYFVGKPCTVLTVSTCLTLPTEKMLQFVFGIVEAVDDDGILLRHTITGCKAYIRLQYVVSVSEEQAEYEGTPGYEEAVREYQEKKPDVKQWAINTKAKIDPAAMAHMAGKLSGAGRPGTPPPAQ